MGGLHGAYREIRASQEKGRGPDEPGPSGLLISTFIEYHMSSWTRGFGLWPPEAMEGKAWKPGRARLW